MLKTMFEISNFDKNLFDNLKEQKRQIIRFLANDFPDKINLIHQKSKISIFSKNVYKLSTLKDDSVITTIDSKYLTSIYNLFVKKVNTKLFNNIDILPKTNQNIEIDYETLLTKVSDTENVYDNNFFENNGFHIAICPPHYSDIFNEEFEEYRIDVYEDLIYENILKPRKYFSLQIGGVGNFVQHTYNNLILQLSLSVGDNSQLYIYNKDNQIKSNIDMC